MTPIAISRLLLPAAAAILALSACSSAQSTTEPAATAAVVAPSLQSAAPSPATTDEAMTDEEPAATAPGTYVSLADYEGDKAAYDAGKVVLFFHASWCPTCKATEENLNADPAAVPAGLTIVKVDFDNSDDLRKKYGVTTQHTFVQVDAAGTELAKWSGSPTAQDIDAQTV